jgi:5'-nucleotidase
MRKILLTNDDGINADGLIRLAKAARNFGEVWVVAPDSERSAMSHSLTLRHPIEVWETDFPVEGVRAYACDGRPADCARIGILNIVPGRPDLLFSGINYGYNVAADIQYSATAGAAFEGAYQGCPSIAFSEHADPDHRVTDIYIEQIMEELMDKPLAINQIWNVNFPGCTPEECKGILRDRKVSTDGYFRDRYRETVISENRRAYEVNGIRNYDADEGTDLRAVFDKYISIGIVKNIS